MAALGMLATTAWAEAPTPHRPGVGLSVQETLAIAAANDHGDTVVRLQLRGGGSLEGVVLAHRPDKSSTAIAHHDGTSSVANVNDIVAVTVLDAGHAKQAFRGNRIYFEPEDTAPTPLAFKRKLIEFAALSPVRVVATFSEPQLDSPACRFIAEKVLSALNAAVANAAKDKMGRDAFARFGNQVRVDIRTGTALTLEPEQATLILRFDCEAPLQADYVESIRTRLDGLL
jgi:hypothetical protein